MRPATVPFEFPYRWPDLAEQFDLDLPDEVVALLELRDRALENYLSRPKPLVFHWPGATADHVDVRNEPGWFESDGTIAKIRYAWATAPLVDATVEWELDGVAAFTHTLTGGAAEHSEFPAVHYRGEAICAIVTSADSTATGLTAFVTVE